MPPNPAPMTMASTVCGVVFAVMVDSSVALMRGEKRWVLRRLGGIARAVSPQVGYLRYQAASFANSSATSADRPAKNG